MARDLPEYTRQQTIQPQAAPIQMEQAVSQAHVGINLIGKLGQQLAQESSNQQARLAGTEAGKTPGRTLLPPLTESDKEFTNAYKAQEYATVMNNTSQHLRNLYTKAIRNPTQHSLLEFMTRAQQGISDATEKLTPENQHRARQDLQGVYLTAQNEIDDKVYGHNQKTQRDRFTNDLSTLVRLVNDVGLKNPDEATRLTNEYINNLESYKGLFTDDELKEFTKILIDNLGTTHKLRDAQALIRAGKMEAKLKELAKLPATMDNIDTANIYKNAYNNYQSMVTASENITYAQYTQKRIEGRLSEADTAYLKRELSPLRFAEFELDTAKWILANKDKQDMYNFYEKNKGNAIALSELTPGQLDDVFAENLKRISEQTGRPVDFATEANLAKEIDIPIPSFTKKLNNAIASSNPAIAALGAQIYGQMSLNYPRAVSGVTTDNGLRAESLNRLLSTDVPLEEAMQSINKLYETLSPTQIREREETYKFLAKDDKNLKNIEKQKEYLADKLGLNPWFGNSLSLPDGAVLEFMDLVKSNYIKSGNIADAKEDAWKRVQTLYQKTNINGREQLMRNAPTRWMKDDEARDALDKQLFNLFAENNKDFEMNDTSNSLFSYRLLAKDLKDAKTSEEILQALGVHKEIKVERTDAAGNKIMGTIQVEPDKYSEFMPVGTNASYGIYFKADNDFKLSPVYDAMKGYSNARFVITTEQMIEKNRTDKLMKDLRNQERDQSVKEIQELQKKVRDMRIAEGEDLYGYPG